MAERHEQARIAALGGAEAAVLWDEALRAIHTYANATRAFPGANVIDHFRTKGEESVKAMFAAQQASREPSDLPQP